MTNAVEEEDLSEIKRLVKEVPKCKEMSAIINHVLHTAAEKGWLKIVKKILARNISIESIDEIGETSLSAALRNGHMEVARELINSGATFPQKLTTPDTNVIIPDDIKASINQWIKDKQNIVVPAV